MGLSGGVPLSTPMLAQRRPGEIFAGGLKQVREKLASFQGEEVVEKLDKRVMMAYLEIVLRPSFPSPPWVHTNQELRTIAATLDAIVEGDLARAGDICMGRSKALEESVLEGSWDLAQELEVLPSRHLGISTEVERRRAASLQLQKAKLRETLDRLSGSSGR